MIIIKFSQKDFLLSSSIAPQHSTAQYTIWTDSHYIIIRRKCKFTWIEWWSFQLLVSEWNDEWMKNWLWHWWLQLRFRLRLRLPIKFLPSTATTFSFMYSLYTDYGRYAEGLNIPWIWERWAARWIEIGIIDIVLEKSWVRSFVRLIVMMNETEWSAGMARKEADDETKRESFTNFFLHSKI